MATQIGKRYSCKTCGSEFIVTKGSKGELICCGNPLEIITPKPKAVTQ